MDVASFGFAVAQTADKCLKYGKLLIEKYQAYRNAKERIRELVLRIEGVWVKTEHQVQFLQKIAPTLGDRLASYQDNALSQLYLKLSAAYADIDRITSVEDTRNGLSSGSKGRSLSFKNKVHYSALEESLREAVASLEDWHNRFDPSWYLLALIADSSVDRSLKDSTATSTDASFSSLKAIREIIYRASPTGGSIFRDPDTIEGQRSPIDGTSATVARLRADSTLVIVDSTAYPDGSNIAAIAAQVSDLARVLSASDPETIGLLNCAGAVQVQPQAGKIAQYELLFRVPVDLERPRSLRAMISGEDVALDEKFALSKALARSVLAVHVAGFVHKNIRPDTVLIFQDSKTGGLKPFLVGFEQFRHVNSSTHLAGDGRWERNLYRHPKRQGVLPEDVFTMYHDIYSLGVCLLEVGIWQSFVGKGTPGVPSAALDIKEHLARNNMKRAALEIKQKLVDMAIQRLPVAMGRTYASVVTSCLTVLDGTSGGSDIRDKDVDENDGVSMGVQFIEKVLLRLEAISL